MRSKQEIAGCPAIAVKEAIAGNLTDLKMIGVEKRVGNETAASKSPA